MLTISLLDRLNNTNFWRLKMKGKRLVTLTLVMAAMATMDAKAQASSAELNVSNEVLEQGERAQTARGKTSITVSDDVVERGHRAQAARGKGPSAIQASDDVLERGNRAQTARGKGTQAINASDDVLERGTRAQAARSKGTKSVQVSEDVLDRGHRAQATRGKNAKTINASDDVLERGTRAQSARGKGAKAIGASDDIARNKQVLSASDDVAAGASKSSGGMAKASAKGAAGGGALYLGVDIAIHVAEGGELKDYRVDKEELALQVAVGAAGPAGGGVYAAYKLFKQEKDDPGKAWRDIKNGDINVSATDAVMIGGVKGLAAWATYNFLKQELKEPGKTRNDAYTYIERITGQPLSEQEKEDIDTAFKFYVPGYAVYQFAVDEASQPGKTPADAYALIEKMRIPLTDEERSHIDTALRVASPPYSIFNPNADKTRQLNYLLSPRRIAKSEVERYKNIAEFSMALHARKTAWERVAFVEAKEQFQPEELARLFAPVPKLADYQTPNFAGVNKSMDHLIRTASPAGQNDIQRVVNSAQETASWSASKVRQGAHRTREGFTEFKSGVSSTARDIGSRVQPAAQRVGARVNEMGDQFGHRVNNTRNAAGDLAINAAKRIDQVGHTAGKSASQVADKVGDTGKKAAKKVQGSINNATKEIGDMIR